MPKTTYPKDRFDELPPDSSRVGAHRAENPRMRGGIVFAWAAVATVVLIAAGIFGTLLITGRITLVPEATPVVTPAPVVTPVLDTTYEVLVLNATPEDGLANRMCDEVIAAGWSGDLVLAGEAGSDDFATTTVYYPAAADEAAARGLAEAIGGAEVAESTAYQPTDDADTADVDESQARRLTLVIGLDRSTAGAATPAP